MKTDVVMQSSALAQNASSNERRLGEGDSVYVKVIKNLGSGKYIASLEGKIFSITSEISLSEGESFLSKIKIENNKILLVQQLENGIFKTALENANGIFDQNGKITNPEIIKYFEKLGLFPDFVNYSLFQTLKSLGLNFSLQFFSKARQIASKFKGKEAEAAKIAMILIQKGIEPSEENVRSILFDSESDFSEPENNFENEEKLSLRSEKKENENLENQIFSVLKNFFDSILKGENTKNNRLGKLTLFNHSGFSKKGIFSSGSWIKVPFEFDFMKNDKKNVAFGDFFLFLSSEESKLKKIAVKLNFFEKMYKFVILLNDSSGKILVNENFDVSNLKKAFPDFDFEYSVLLSGEEFPIDEESLKIVDGSA